MSFSYVASPYSDPDSDVRERRYREAVAFVRWAAERGIPVVSPIVLWHVAGEGLPHDAEYWAGQNDSVLARASEIIVVKNQGWKASAGIAREIRLARSLNLPIRHADPWVDGDYLLADDPEAKPSAQSLMCDP